MEVSLGRVVGSRIRIGKTMPTEFPKWLDGDIFIHNLGNIPFYEYKSKSSQKLIYLGNLKGPQGPQGPQGEQGVQGEAGDDSYERIKRVSIMPSDVEEELGETAATYPFWKGILTTLDIREGLSENYDKVFFIEVEDPKQNDKVNYLIIQNEFEYIITNFKSFIDYNKSSQTYKVYDLIDLYNRPAELYRHNIYLNADAPYIFLEFSITTNKKEPLTKDDIVNYCAFTYGHTITGCTGDVLTPSMEGKECYILAAYITDVDTDTPKITVKYFNNADKTIASISNDLIQFHCNDTVIKL